MTTEHCVEFEGYCPICEKETIFKAKGEWLRSALRCATCANSSAPRERALAYVLNRELPHWRHLDIHESSPAMRGISAKLQRECRRYIGSHYFPDKPFGIIVDGWRNENIESQTFESESFDLVVTLDVLEHVFHPDLLFKEIHRTLRPGGLYISTFPIHKQQVEPTIQRAILKQDGSIAHLMKPEYHGNPIDSNGALVTYDYGYDIHKLVPTWAPFDVEISRFSNKRLGILGEFTEVMVCRKR